MSQDVDVLIAGGGLSGLSLAAHLATGPDRSVLVIDDGAAPADSSWAFWSATPGLLDAAVSRSYPRVRVHAAGFSGVLPLGRYRYRVVRGADLRRVAADLVRQRPGFEVRRGRVERIETTGGLAEAVVDGRLIRASWAFDSVSRVHGDATVDGHLAFTGWEVHCSRPAFDPDVPVLFDFRIPQGGGARFVYVLPDGPCRALVELTEFTGRHHQPSTSDDREAGLLRYLAAVGPYQLRRRESAVLPLRTARRRRVAGRVMTIGANGGLIKASTGYAYQRIQRDSAAIAASLARHGHPLDVPAPRRRRRMLDALLLAVLDREPPQLERAFARLFATQPAERVLRFLDEDTSRSQESRLLACLPAAPYLRAAIGRGAAKGRAAR
jgi:lycopene beta-cyclase